MLSQIAGGSLSFMAFSLFLPDWSQEFRSPISPLQLGPGLFGLASALAALVIGAMVDRYGG